MKATLWLCTLVTTMLFASPSIYGSPLTDYQYRDSRSLQENYLAAKRTKPSLSIVNPLDVLRQRLLLEIARRQMRENTKQVEMNREYLKTIGKRGKDLDYFDFDHNDIENDNENENEINYNNKKSGKTNDDDYQVKYVYSLHKNRFSNK